MRVTSSAAFAFEDAFRAHQRFIWGLCYRMTGCAADADDLVQETFARAVEHPPARTQESWRPWLVRVAMNLARDALRRRKRQRYIGPWLPSPIETGDENESPPAHEPVIDGKHTTEGRYELIESVSFAFLLALEVLTPQQRAVLLLRDVFDYSVHDTAGALDMSESNVKTVHHRARRAMEAYDRKRRPLTRDLQQQTRNALERFLAALASQDISAVEALLAEPVRLLNDGAGEFFAARVPIVGPRRVARFNYNISRRRTVTPNLVLRMINGLPAVLVTFNDGKPGEPPRAVMRCDIDQDGRIRQLHSIVATRKLTAVQFPA